MTETTREIYMRNIEYHGATIQIFKMIEEMGELTQALMKLAGSPAAPDADYDRLIDHAAEEVADVRIMLEQICMIFAIEDRAGGWRYRKLTRLKAQLDKREGNES